MPLRGLEIWLLLACGVCGQEGGSSDPAVHLVAIPSTAHACSELVFSGAGSHDPQGGAQFFWSLGANSASDALLAVLSGATAANSRELTISPSVLSQTAPSLGGRLEVELTVAFADENRTNLTVVAFANIVGSASQAQPAIFPVGPTQLTMPRSERLELAVTTEEASFALDCAGRDPRRGPGPANVTWYHSFMGAWQPLTSSELTDLAVEPNRVSIGAFTLQAGSSHLLKAEAAFDLQSAARPAVLFKVDVEPMPPVKVHILGPRRAAQCGFELEAETWDPVAATSAPEDFQFAWDCFSVVEVGEIDACAELPNFIPARSRRTDGSGASGPKMRVAAGDLPAGLHEFSVTVRRRGLRDTGTVAISSMQVIAGLFTAVQVPFPSYGYSGINDADSVPPTSASVDLRETLSIGSCTAPAVSWRWVLVEDAIPPLLDRVLPTKLVAAEGMLQIQAGGGGTMVPGRRYYHALLQSSFQDIIDALDSVDGRPALGTLSGISVAAATPKFVADQSPSDGAVTVTPETGRSLRTTFLVNTFNWTDELPLDLKYEFIRFEAVGSEGLQVDWDDPTSSRFWRKVGHCFRPPRHSPKAFLQAPPGQHLVVVRAWDPRGQASVVASELLVVDAESDFSVADVTALIARTEVTNDPSQLLQAAIAIAVVADPAVKIRTCRTDSFGTERCDQIPSEEVVRPVLNSLSTAAPFMGSELLGMLGIALEGTIKVAAEPSLQQVDATKVFGDSLNPGNFSEDDNNTEPPEPVFVNISRIQVLPEFLMTVTQLLTTTQQRVLLDQASDPSIGLDGFAAEEVLKALAITMWAIQGSPGADVVSLAPKVRALIDGLGAASLPKVPFGSEQRLRTPPDLSYHAEMVLAKAAPGSNIELAGVNISRDLLGRRLQSCEMDAQITEWYNLNPLFAAPAGFGVTDLVLPNTTIKGLFLRLCGQPVLSEDLDSPLEIDIDIVHPEGVQMGYVVEHLCAVYDTGLGAWSTDGVALKDAVDNESSQLTCLSNQSYGYFAALYRVVREAPPDPTTSPPPVEDDDTGVSVEVILGIVIVVALGAITAGFKARKWYRSRQKVEPEKVEEPEEEEEEETETDSEVSEPPDPDPALTKLRMAAEAGRLTAKEILAHHAGPTGIRQELIWAVDKGYEAKLREARKKAFKNIPAEVYHDSFGKQIPGDFTVVHVKAKAEFQPRKPLKALETLPDTSPSTMSFSPSESLENSPRSQP
mmetsp:Transcript_101206/g.241309  ORF Transcript_101206/g.241309 Transcript_101206/m.241309 type:complete len:1221 (-) Transcript_101206:89-3751(-)